MKCKIEAYDLIEELRAKQKKIAATKMLFKEIEKTAKPVTVDEKVAKPVLDFSDSSYQTIHNTYAESLKLLQLKRKSAKPQRKEYAPIELASQQMSRARHR
jgi:hypothetical protein